MPKGFDKCKTMCYIHRMKLPKLVWDEWNREHIKKHRVTVTETEEVYIQRELILKGKHGRVEIISKIRNGRMITIFLSFDRQQRPYVVTARDSSKKERSTYYEKIRQT